MKIPVVESHHSYSPNEFFEVFEKEFHLLNSLSFIYHLSGQMSELSERGEESCVRPPINFLG